MLSPPNTRCLCLVEIPGGQLGSRSAILPLRATVFVYVGFLVIGLVFVTESLTTVSLGTKWVWHPVLPVVAV